MVTLAGIPIGKGNWTIEIGDTHYSAAASGATTGLMRVLTEGEGTTAAHGTLGAGKVLTATYASTIKSRKKKDEVRVTLDKGNVKDFKADPPPDHDRERVPVTEADRQNVLDPMTASLLASPATAIRFRRKPASARCAIFDGRLRYDLQLAFKRMDTVKAEKGYAGPVVVCAVYFTPIGGYIPSRAHHQIHRQAARYGDLAGADRGHARAGAVPGAGPDPDRRGRDGGNPVRDGRQPDARLRQWPQGPLMVHGP